MRQVYRATNSSKLFSLVFLAVSLFVSVMAWRELSAGINSMFTLLITLIFVLVGAGLTAQTFTSSVILSDDSISHGSVFRRQSISLDQIRYRREYEEYKEDGEGGTTVDYLEFIPRNEGPMLKIPKDAFNLDHAFWEVVMRIPEF